MAEIIEMPKLSDTMTEGVVAGWNKKVGDKVTAGELLAEIETDKATMEMESFYDGILLHTGVEKGGSVPVGGLLAIVGQKGEDISSLLEKFKNKMAAGDAPAVEEKKGPAVVETPAVQTHIAASSAPSVISHSNGNGDGRLKASPLAKALAQEKGIDIRSVSGSGDGGRIVKRDIETFVQSGGSKPVPVHIPQAVGKESFSEVPVSQMRKTIAKRLVESKNTAPHFYLTMEIDMENAVKSREDINTISPVKISFNDMIIKAVAASLRMHPKVNSSWLGDKIRYNEHIHVGMAVAVEDGLIVPVIRFTDTLGLANIATQTRSLAERARNRQLQPQDWEGNTFTISNLGMFGIESFTAIINPPDACILAVGGISDVPVVKNGQVVPGKVMKVTLSCDHRVVDGALGSDFLRTFKQMMENPVRILI